MKIYITINDHTLLQSTLDVIDKVDAANVVEETYKRR